MDQQGLLKCTNKNLQVSAPISIRNCSNFAGIGVSSRCKQKFTSAHACKRCWLKVEFGLCKRAPLVNLGFAKKLLWCTWALQKSPMTSTPAVLMDYLDMCPGRETLGHQAQTLLVH